MILLVWRSCRLLRSWPYHSFSFLSAQVALKHLLSKCWSWSHFLPTFLLFNLCYTNSLTHSFRNFLLSLKRLVSKHEKQTNQNKIQPTNNNQTKSTNECKFFSLFLQKNTSASRFLLPIGGRMCVCERRQNQKDWHFKILLQIWPT